MKMTLFGSPGSSLSFNVGIIVAVVGLALGILAGLQPLWLCLAIASIVLVICFFTFFEQTVLGLLILRSSLDIFSAQQVPAIFAVGLDALTILYVVVSILLNRKIYTNKLLWFLIAWIACQGLWVILLPLGGLGRGSGELLNAIEEWIRLFSWVVVYFLIMQLKGHIHPERIINWLFFSLIAPLTVALIQIIFPPSMLPSLLVFATDSIEAGSRINGTIGHPNGLASFIVLFTGLSIWKLGQTRKRLYLLILMGLMIFVLASTKSLGGLILITVFSIAFFIPRLNLTNLLGLASIIALVITFFISSDLGQERLASMNNTPLLNPDLDLSTTLLVARDDGNSFNWRIAQWTYLLNSWQEFPIMGYGLATTRSVSVFENYAHNDYLAALVEGGIIGFINFLAFLAAQYTHLIRVLFRPISQSTRGQRLFCSILISFLIALSVAMIAANIFTQTTLWFYWLTLMTIVDWNWSKTGDIYV